MKIGIITFQQAINYGAVLQLYALQKVVSDLGGTVEIINYISPKIENDYKLLRINRGVKAFLASVISVIAFSKKKFKFKKFVDKFVDLSKSISDKKELYNLSKGFDYIITGSDQVWNYQITEADNTYLLDFVEPQKRLAYAASFGVSKLPQALKENYRELLSPYSYITVRENQGAEIVKDLCGKEVSVVLDPTLLLGKCDWQVITESIPVSKRKIVVYTLFKSDLLINLAKKLSEETGLEIAIFNPRVRNIYDDTSVYCSGPEDFVSIFMNAEYILTNSFHGTAFSINFNKKFLVELPRGEGGQRNSRIETIIELLNLKDRYIDTLDLNKMYADIDWDSVNNILDTEREKSMEHLKKMIWQNE